MFIYNMIHINTYIMYLDGLYIILDFLFVHVFFSVIRNYVDYLDVFSFYVIVDNFLSLKK